MFKKYPASLLIIVVVGVFADCITKTIALSKLKNHSLFIGKQRLGFELTSNSGSAFSFFQSSTIFITILAVVVVTFIIYYIPKCENKLMRYSLALIVAGALGNILDRFIRFPYHGKGHVVDFIVLWKWPTFNIADSLVSIGVVLALYSSFKSGKTTKETIAEKS